MGIPAYFRYLIKIYPQIFSKSNTVAISHFLLDSNSIIYDVVRDPDIVDYSFDAIIHGVIAKIEGFMRLISPSEMTMIAFDGVAPLAKLKQQKERRYRTMLDSSSPIGFDTTQITPGTPFMMELSGTVRAHFAGNKRVIVTGSDEPGEGEHKLFQWLRGAINKESELAQGLRAGGSVLVYGLDADLIMLSLAHLPVCPRIYLYRDKDNDLVKDHFMDIPELARRLEIPSLDYLFLGFFLGNDFMPKFPSLCIRTDGIQRLMSAYAMLGEGKRLVEGKTIIWRNVRALIVHLAANEHAFLLEEYAHRRKQAKYIKADDAQAMYPMLAREVEEYIAPEKPFWRDRYYQTLFRSRPTPERKRQIALNYLEGLEWTLRYYVDGCPDWGWTYKHEYPPLLEDLLECVPYFETEFIQDNKRKPVTAAEQLAYVMPTPGVVYETQHSFTKFGWEAHVLVPPFGRDK